MFRAPWRLIVGIHKTEIAPPIVLKLYTNIQLGVLHAQIYSLVICSLSQCTKETQIDYFAY